MTSDPKVLDLLQRAWTINVTNPDASGDVEITIAELPEFVVAGPPSRELNTQFWDAFSSYLASFTSRGETPDAAPPAAERRPMRQLRRADGAAEQSATGHGDVAAVTVFSERALATA